MLHLTGVNCSMTLNLLKTSKLKDLTNYIKMHQAHYTISKPLHNYSDADSLCLELPTDEVIKRWLEDFAKFAHEITELRFSEMQGYAFRMMRVVTKYNQFLKRDGSVIMCIKDGNSVITDEDLVGKKLVQSLQKKDDELVLSSVIPIRKTPKSLHL